MSISPNLEKAGKVTADLTSTQPQSPQGRGAAWQVAPDLFSSFRYAWAGVSYAFKTQRNFRIHTGIGIFVLALGLGFRVSGIEAAILCLTVGAVLVMELLNTALESLVDLTVGQTYHELAKIAKDCAAGAVLIAAIAAVIIAICVFSPHVLALAPAYF